MPSISEEIKAQSMLAALSDSQLDNLLQHSITTSLKKNQVLFQMGEPSTQFYYLQSGQVKIARNSQQGLEKVLAIVHPGQLFAEAVMFIDGGKFPATASALKPSKVIGFPNKIFTNYLRDSHDLSMAMLSNLSGRLHKQIIEIDNLTMQNANHRILNFIDALITVDDKNTAEIELPGLKNTIASRLSMTPETFSRALHTLGEKNIIILQGKGRSIKIPDLKAFKQYLLSN